MSLSNTNDTSTSDFDRSFEAYAEHPPLFAVPGDENNDDSNDDNAVDVSFDSDTFPATIASARSAVLSALQETNDIATDDDDDNATTVHVTLHETLSAVYHGANTTTTTSQPVIAVTGIVRVRTTTPSHRSLELVLRDPAGVLAQIEPVEAYCTSVQPTQPTNNLSGVVVHANDVADVSPPQQQHVLRLELPAAATDTSSYVSVAKYRCTTSLQPVPLLIQTRIVPTATTVRMGMKLRASPYNTERLEHVTIVMAVPPLVDPPPPTPHTDSGRMVWNALQRTLTWPPLAVLAPGTAHEWQLVFPRCTSQQQQQQQQPDNNNDNEPLVFPIVVQATQREFAHWSGVQVIVDVVSSSSSSSSNRRAPTTVVLETTGEILHRSIG